MTDTHANSAKKTSLPSRLLKYLLLLIVLLLISGVLLLSYCYFKKWYAPIDYISRAEFTQHNYSKLDLSQPDLLIESQSLIHLPRDLLTIPLLRDTLTEDFVFYYQHHADKLDVIGSLRRIIYEHHLHLQDTLIEELLSQPANIALWQNKNGYLSHFMIEMHQSGLTKLLEPLLIVAANDTQLRKVGLLTVNGDQEIPLFSLRYAANKSLQFASYNDTLLLLSDHLAELDDKPNTETPIPPDIDQSTTATNLHTFKSDRDIVIALLQGDSPWQQHLGLSPSDSMQKQDPALKHRIVVNARYLTLGYQRFMPIFAGLRFEMNDKGWESYLALHDKAAAGKSSLNFQPIWQSLPMGASVCLALPIEQALLQALANKFSQEDLPLTKLSRYFTGAAGLCWYPDSRLYTPLFVAQLDKDLSVHQDDELTEIFTRFIGAGENKTADRPSTITVKHEQGSHLWQRDISSTYGQYDRATSVDSDIMKFNKFFRASLLRKEKMIAFSLDDKLIEKAAMTVNHMLPPMADFLPNDVIIPVYIAPNGVANTLQQEIFASLPKSQHPVFHNAMRMHLLPKLAALADHQENYLLSLPLASKANEPWQWIPIEWRTLP